MPQRVTITFDGDSLLAFSPFAGLADTFRSIPGGRWNGNAWVYAATPATAAAAWAAFHAPGIDLRARSQADVDRLKALCAQAAGVDLVRKAEADGLAPIPHCRLTPWQHQLRGYHMICTLPATMLAWDMGTGKTKAVVDAIVNLHTQLILIVAPCSVVDVWPREFAKHGALPVHCEALREGPVKDRLKRAETVLGLWRGRRPVVLVVNYEATRTDALAAWLLKQPWDMIVCDEAHRIKSPGGKDSRFMAKLGRKVKKRVCLTGTPMAHGPLDVYGQFRFLDPGIFGTSFVAFRNRYARMGGFGGHQVLGYQNQDELNKKFYSISDRVMADDVLDLPEVVTVDREVHLCDYAKRIYGELADDFIAEARSGIITASNALSKLLRLHQISSGHCVTETPTGDEHMERCDTAKADALGEIFADVAPAEPVVVFCLFRPDLDVVAEQAKAAGRPCYRLQGGRNELAEWQAGTGGDVLAVQIQAGGLGVDLTRARYCIYYSVGFSLGDYLQSLARTHRQGQTRKVEYIHLVAVGTVDRKIYTALEQKQEIIEAILKEICE